MIMEETEEEAKVREGIVVRTWQQAADVPPRRTEMRAYENNK